MLAPVNFEISPMEKNLFFLGIVYPPLHSFSGIFPKLVSYPKVSHNARVKCFCKKNCKSYSDMLSVCISRFHSPGIYRQRNALRKNGGILLLSK